MTRIFAGLLTLWGSQAFAVDLLSTFDPVPGSPEDKVFHHVLTTGVTQDLSLHIIPRKLQSDFLHSCTGRRPLSGGFEDKDWNSICDTFKMGGLNDGSGRSWILETPAIFQVKPIRRVLNIEQHTFGKKFGRAFIAAHELGHGTLRRIAESGRLTQDLPNAFPVLAADDVFRESFSDLFAVGVFSDLYGIPQVKIAGQIAKFRREIAKTVEGDDRETLIEMAELLVNFAQQAEQGNILRKGADQQVTDILQFLCNTGVFESMLAGPERWKQINEEGCFDCFRRRSITRRSANN